MSELQNISHVYKGLLERNRAFAAFKDEELAIIYSDLSKYICEKDSIFDPMSGYGGSMSFFGKKGEEAMKISCAEEFFNQLTLDGYKVSFKTQLNNNGVKSIIEEIVKGK